MREEESKKRGKRRGRPDGLGPSTSIGAGRRMREADSRKSRGRRVSASGESDSFRGSKGGAALRGRDGVTASGQGEPRRLGRKHHGLSGGKPLALKRKEGEVSSKSSRLSSSRGSLRVSASKTNVPSQGGAAGGSGRTDSRRFSEGMRKKPSSRRSFSGELSSARDARLSHSAQGRGPRSGGKPGVSRGMSAAAQARARAEERSAVRAQRQRVALIVVLVCIFISGIVMGITYIRGNLKRHSAAVNVVPTDLYTPVACSPSMLQATVQVDDGRVGSPVNIVVTLRNTSADNPCYINVGTANMKVNITSGDAQVSDVSSCGSWDESKILLLNREMSTNYTVSWDGGSAASGCGSTGNIAAAGTYVAAVSFADGSVAQAVDSFVLR